MTVDQETAVEQQAAEMPLDTVACVKGEAIQAVPEDLYIPPEALQVFLEAFQGPLDFLLYLIKKHNLDILDIPIAKVTDQYMQYIGLMEDLKLELAADYLVMAATLAEIKSRLLLPKPEGLEEDEEDPRAELVRRLQEYEQFKQAAEQLDQLPRRERDIFVATAEVPALTSEQKPLPQLELQELVVAFQKIMRRAGLQALHQVTREPLSMRERMTQVLDAVKSKEFVEFTSLFNPEEEGRIGVVVTFISLLELLRQMLIEVVQAQPYGPIHIRQRGEV